MRRSRLMHHNERLGKVMQLADRLPCLSPLLFLWQTLHLHPSALYLSQIHSPRPSNIAETSCHNARYRYHITHIYHPDSSRIIRCIHIYIHMHSPIPILYFPFVWFSLGVPSSLLDAHTLVIPFYFVFLSVLVFWCLVFLLRPWCYVFHGRSTLLTSPSLVCLGRISRSQPWAFLVLSFLKG